MLTPPNDDKAVMSKKRLGMALRQAAGWQPGKGQTVNGWRKVAR